MVRMKKNNIVYNKNIYQCIVPGCQNVDNDTNDPSIYFFIISEDGVHQSLLIKFLENVPIRPKISRICSAHFADNCFELHNGVKLLKPNAVPTIRPKNILSSLKSDESIQNIGKEKGMGEKINIKNDDNILMGPPQTTVVKKSQLKNVQKDATTLSPSKEPITKKLHAKSPPLQSLNGHLQIGRQEEQLRQLSYRQELQLLRQQNKNLQYQPHQEQHNKTSEKQPVLAQHQRQQQGNGESNDLNQTKSLCHRQQQKNKSNIKIPVESKQSLQQNEDPEELKWLEQQKHKKNQKQQLKRLQELKRVERHNRNLSKQKARILPKHKQQEQLMENLKRRPEQHHQNNRHLQTLLLAPPQQEQHYHLMLLQREYLKDQPNLQESQRQNCHQQKEHQQLQFPKDSQKSSNQQFKQKQEHLQKEKMRQQQYKHKQMEFEQQQQHPKSQLQEKQHISTERQLRNVQAKKQEQSKSQTPSPIPHEQEHLIICGYITFESCNNNFSYSCSFCSKNFENLNGFSAHLIRLHTNEIENEINSKRLNKGDKIIAKEPNREKQKCGIISISSKLYNLFLNCDDFKYDCNFCDKKFEAINKFSEHIGKRHLDLLEKDKVNDMEFEDDIEIDPSCILSFDQIDEINEVDNFLNSVTASSNNINNNKIVMSVPMSDNSEIFMTLDINENNKNNIKKNNNSKKSNNKEIIEEQNIVPMELDSLEKPKLKLNIKHSSWATRYFS